MNWNQTKQGFAKESQELLWDMEDALVRIESGGSKEDMKTFFQSVHALRKSAESFGCTHVMSFARAVESLVGKMRDYEIKPADRVVASLFLCCDLLRGLVNLLAYNPAGKPDTGIGDVIKYFITVDVPAMSSWMLAGGEATTGSCQAA